MRFILPTVLAFAATHNPTTDACGWEPPRLVPHFVTAHSVKLADNTWERRAFVLFGDAPKFASAHWHALAPETYDNIRLAEMSRSRAMLTLIGPSGTRVVTATHRVALDGGWDLGGRARLAFEVDSTDKDQFTIALDGNFADATWHEIEGRYTRTWPISGTNVDVTSTDKGAVIRVGNKELATVQASVLGAIDSRGSRYIVTRDAKGELAIIDAGWVGLTQRATS